MHDAIDILHRSPNLVRMVEIAGNTTPGDMTAVELVAVQVAPVFMHAADEAASLNAFTYYYQGLGAL